MRTQYFDMKSYQLFYITLVILASACNKNSTVSKDNKENANALVNESSPYLLQHAYNPVDWYPWNEEALKKAEKEDKLMIISVGYAACHWCHVMEHESFEDSTVAALMNENFVSIKVDREERPDVDDVYMTAAHLINGSGGWPLNAIALPNGKPIYAGTYYPKEQWMDILQRFVSLKEEDPDRLIKSANELTEGIQGSNLIEVNSNPFDYSLDSMSDLVANCLARYDKKDGGKQGAPKFPFPNAYEFLMKFHWHTGDKAALETTLLSLDKMAKGGIYDQLGGGFARYSTDAKWLVPHFEKMLYDNGQMVSIYAQAYQLTKNPLYKSVVEETIAFVERELMSSESGFYSSLDADSEGEEGKFYVWSEEEIDAVIGTDAHATIFKKLYDVSKRGNWEHTNVLNVVNDLEKLAKKEGVALSEAQEKISEYKSALLKKRGDRVRPGTDDKVLTSWNALMLSGLVDAYFALGNKAYLDRAIKNGEFLVAKQLSEDGRLDRNYKNGQASINAFLDDYALTINAFLKLYQATFDNKWLDYSEKMTSYAKQYFYNEETKMYNYTSSLDPPLVAKKAEYNDNVIPSSNSAMARSLFTLGTLTYNREYLDMSQQMLNNMMNKVTTSDFLIFYSNWMQLLLDNLKSPYEIAIVGENADAIRKEFASNYLGNSILLGSEGEGTLDLLKDKYLEGATMIYVCQNKVCKRPVEEVDKALTLLTP